MSAARVRFCQNRDSLSSYLPRIVFLTDAAASSYSLGEKVFLGKAAVYHENRDAKFGVRVDFLLRFLNLSCRKVSTIPQMRIRLRHMHKQLYSPIINDKIIIEISTNSYLWGLTSRHNSFCCMLVSD